MADLPLPDVVGYFAGPEVRSKGYRVRLHDVLDHGCGIAPQCVSIQDAKDDVLGIDHDADILKSGSHPVLEITYALL